MIKELWAKWWFHLPASIILSLLISLFVFGFLFGFSAYDIGQMSWWIFLYFILERYVFGRLGKKEKKK